MSSSLTGALGEQRAIVHLLERGHKVAIPVLDDDGVDLVVNYRTRVQVKTASHVNGGHSWLFHFGRGRYLADGTALREKKRWNADILICHAVPIDAWWILTVEALAAAAWTPEKTALSLTDEPRYATKYRDLSENARDAWHLFDVGGEAHA